jgi:hypothetical protein
MSSENKENNKDNTMENGNNKRAQQMSNDECESIFGKSPESDISGIQDTLVTSIYCNNIIHYGWNSILSIHTILVHISLIQRG